MYPTRAYRLDPHYADDLAQSERLASRLRYTGPVTARDLHMRLYATKYGLNATMRRLTDLLEHRIVVTDSEGRYALAPEYL